MGYTAPSPSTRLRCDPGNAVCPTPAPTNKFVSYYFRTSVEVPPADFASFATFRLRVLRDDAAVVYVNGVERGRSPNIAAAPAIIGYESLATSSVGTASWTGTSVDTFDLDASAFVPGTNVIAVELHQQSATSSDVAFDAELIGVPLSVTRGPFLQVTTPTSTIIRWRTSAAHVGRVRVGPSPGVFTATFDESVATASPFDHEIKVTGLTPGTRYYYDVGTTSNPWPEAMQRTSSAPLRIRRRRAQPFASGRSEIPGEPTTVSAQSGTPSCQFMPHTPPTCSSC